MTWGDIAAVDRPPGAGDNYKLAACALVWFQSVSQRDEGTSVLRYMYQKGLTGMH